MSSKNYNQNGRHNIASIDLFGVGHLHLRNPYIITWWSCAFPGFGHISLGYYLKGILLIFWELIVNVQAHLNQAMAETFTGDFAAAKETLDPQWTLIYIPVYLFAIWDSYRLTVDMNKLYILADHENKTPSVFTMNSLEINYISNREPWVTFFWSCFMPGLGQLYNHRIIPAFISLSWWMLVSYLSHFYLAIHFMVFGDVSEATASLNLEWFLFMPSIYGFSIYNAYVNTVEQNKLFDREQTKFLKTRYQSADFNMPLK